MTPQLGHALRRALSPRAGIVLAALGLTASLPLAGTGPAQAGPPKPPTTYPYKYTDLGRPGYWAGFYKSYGINTPDLDGVMLVVGGGYDRESTYPPGAVWTVTADGAVIARDDLPPQPTNGTTPSIVCVNDAGMVAYTDYRDGKAVTRIDVPGVGVVEPPSAEYFRPKAMNNWGQVVGIGSYGAYQGVLWTPQDDGSYQAQYTRGFLPYAINDWGVMAGETGVPAIAWFEDGVPRVEELATWTGKAHGINNFGEVVGGSNNNEPFYWSPDAGLIDLGGNGVALSINDPGQIVGYLHGKQSSWYAYLWENGKAYDLTTLAGVGTSSFRLESAHAINNAGHIAGCSRASAKSGVTYGSFLLTPNP